MRGLFLVYLSTLGVYCVCSYRVEDLQFDSLLVLVPFHRARLRMQSCRCAFCSNNNKKLMAMFSSRKISKLAALLLTVAQCSRGTFVSSFQSRSSFIRDLRPQIGRKVTLFSTKNVRYDEDAGVKPTSLMYENDDTDYLKQIVHNLPKAVVSSLVIFPCSALANTFSDQLYNPDNFKPVCAASDSFYRFLQGTTLALVGQENFVEYGPLISGGLLRIRLELCVVESYFSEAIIPFIST
jgi:hypothetical protein